METEPEGVSSVVDIRELTTCWLLDRRNWNVPDHFNRNLKKYPGGQLKVNAFCVPV
jgi:hypothetical protein